MSKEKDPVKEKKEMLEMLEEVDVEIAEEEKDQLEMLKEDMSMVIKILQEQTVVMNAIVDRSQQKKHNVKKQVEEIRKIVGLIADRNVAVNYEELLGIREGVRLARYVDTQENLDNAINMVNEEKKESNETKITDVNDMKHL